MEIFTRDVGNKEKIIIPDDFIVYDLEGQTLMPGMLDSHSHVFSPFIYDMQIYQLSGNCQCKLNLI